MMRTRLRPRHPDEAAFYATRYPGGYDHTVWPDHIERIGETAVWASEALAPAQLRSTIETVADLSCGDGSLVATLARMLGADRVIVGDVNTGGSVMAVEQPLPASLDRLPDGGVDLYVCSETLEHLDDPDGFLAALRPKTRLLLLTTPEGETTDGNPEHYWGWDTDAVRSMLVAAGFFSVWGYQVFTPPYTRFSPDVIPTQMWICA